jgi:hypothetical protein
VRVSMRPSDAGGRRYSDPSLKATTAQIAYLKVLLREFLDHWVEDDEALDWVIDDMGFQVVALEDLTNGQIGKCFEELGR